MSRSKQFIPRERIDRSILLLRGRKVMLSTHLAALYDVEPRVLVQAIKRNRERFPADFMFQLSAVEWNHLKSQIVISSWEVHDEPPHMPLQSRGSRCFRPC